MVSNLTNILFDTKEKRFGIVIWTNDGQTKSLPSTHRMLNKSPFSDDTCIRLTKDQAIKVLLTSEDWDHPSNEFLREVGVI